MSDRNPQNQSYPELFSPLKIHDHIIPNRAIMGSMHTGLEEMRGGFDKLAQYYKERAQGGVLSLIHISEPTRPY